MKNIKKFLLAFVLFFINSVNIFAQTDINIFTDKVYNTYEGTEDAKATIQNLKFNDINNHWAKEPIIKAGAFNMVKGYGKSYKPNNAVSNEEALAFILRAIGLEEEAQAEGEMLKAQANSQSLLGIWSLGYLSLAKKNGLITNAQFSDATNLNQEALPENAFKRAANATREQVATWIIKAINSISQEPLVSNEQQSIYNYSDWKNISSENVNNVEIALDNGIMKGDNKGRFNPKSKLTRAEMAQILVNLDTIYNKIFGYTKKFGTIGGIKDSQTNKTGQSSLEREIYIRNEDGKIDILKYYKEAPNSPQALNKDAVVYNGSSVSGLSGLKEGSKVEYIVKNKNIETKEIFGKLNKINFETGEIQIKDKKNKSFNFNTTDGIIGQDEKGNFAFISEIKRLEKNIPFGEWVNLETKNNVVTKITYVGTHNLTQEIRGIVLENNPEFSYITILDNNGRKITKNYFEDDIFVEKQKHYINGDDIGYLNQMFPNFKYDPKETSINEIEIGDIVFIYTKKDNPNEIEKISASPNYIMKYGKINEITKNEYGFETLVEFSNGQIASYLIPNDTFASKAGKPVSLSEIVSGDWVKLLINEAILEPGESLESIKEIIIEDSGHKIGDIIKGEVGKIDNIQKEISIKNSYTLEKSGWEDFKQIRKLNFENNNIEYYYKDKKVDLPFVEKHLKNSDGQVYIALEEGYSGNSISKITFRTGRDEILEPDVIINSDNVSSFTLASGNKLEVDSGTIIRKDGKLVSPSSISINDYARVSLNEDGKAALIDIYEAPKTENIGIARARVSAINEGKDFTVESMSQLIGNDWVYSPISRKFTIDGNTVFITEKGIETIDKFIGITENSQIGKTFTIVFDGSKATHIVEMPFPTRVVSGTIYSKDKEIILKNGKYIDSKGAWEVVGITDSSIKLEPKLNTIIIKGGKIVSADKLQKGDLVRAITEKLPDKITGGISVEPRIIFVGN